MKNSKIEDPTIECAKQVMMLILQMPGPPEALMVIVRVLVNLILRQLQNGTVSDVMKLITSEVEFQVQVAQQITTDTKLERGKPQ